MFKPILGYEDLYSIDEFGNVLNLRTNNLMSFYISNKGYKIVDLCKDNKRKHFLIHRLVAETFIQNPNNYPIVLHKDNNKLNTHYTNLKWGTYSENNSQAIKDGLNKVPRPDNRKDYKIYSNDRIKRVCKGVNEVINQIGYGTDSTVRNMIFRKESIKSGKYEGCYISKVKIECPVEFLW